MRQEIDSLTVFFDGGCKVCRREIEKYRSLDKDGRLKLVDITEPSFDPSRFGRELSTFMKKLHVQDATGGFYTGIDAFTRIWAVMPQSELHLLSAVIALPGINLMARSGYWLFARCRKFVP